VLIAGDATTPFTPLQNQLTPVYNLAPA
jgi:hypothetical protein